ncbi:glycerol-3-phosphate dehydrogenase/oxidase [Sideroxydans lithotrophicus]|uniref:FAD dependent oxidoreductase n=1 Tax=Sideroxydans lithotrophicus (strain ES-1) TaxID=580332 RepID=D5CML2_SIDLE|nr:glycerol-3-phosphate dehydrogenase/oxidase [Sideroxydans lithotrophicus]ADE12684.1 FAD dependent oxidoreductase [Sideroxydans lithotrophicus ES-1]
MKRDFSALQGEFDLLVCGGGIYGAWTAYDAALRGLRVVLVEQGDWASATSSASSKLIHGGLRYLETYDFKLVRKALKERRMLLQAAPHRVWPLRFGVPVYADSRNGTLKLKAGLTLYDALAGFPGEQMRHRHFDAAVFAEHFPFLDEAHLKGGFTYGDAQTDDARLVLELVAGAMEHGAVCVNYARLVAWNEDRGKVCGASVRDLVTDEVMQVHARQYVSTAGQWTATAEQGPAWCRLSKGIHLVMPALPTSEAILLTAQQDGRVFFIIPWYGRTLLGTTDTDYRGDIEHVTVEENDVDYLLAAAGRYLKSAWTKQDVIGSYAGVRVMKQSDDASPSAVSRDWELKTADNRLYHAIGGKLTSAREDAAVIVDTVCTHLGVAATCATKDRDFPWKPGQDYAAWSEEAMARARSLSIDTESTQWLMRRHGTRIEQVFGIVEESRHLAARIVIDLPFIYADLLLCARDEMALHLSDLLRRRVPLLILARLSEAEIRHLADLVSSTMGWDAGRIELEIGACRP